MVRKPTLLLDMRETDAIRGYHVTAVAFLLIPVLRRCRAFVLTSGHPDGELALNALRFDAGIRLPCWSRLPWLRPWRLDLYLAVMDHDARHLADEVAARCRPRRRILGLIGAAGTLPAGIMDGNDTRAMADAASRMLASLGGTEP
ncbi:MAG TPA: hypothetical protein VD970_05550 [Acetobacteraceae bacterium]|nr:hypothetical protein [Acetobacteraceae bacterium]